MIGDVETAQTSGGHDFPKEWGPPAGTQFSEERAAWVRDRVCRFRGLAALQELERRDVRFLNMLRRAALASMRRTP